MNQGRRSIEDYRGGWVATTKRNIRYGYFCSAEYLAEMNVYVIEKIEYH